MKKVAKLILNEAAQVKDGQSVVLQAKNPDYVVVLADGKTVGYLAKSVAANGRLSSANDIFSIMTTPDMPATIKAEGKGFRVIVNVKDKDTVYYCCGSGNKVIFPAKPNPNKEFNAAVQKLKQAAMEAREAANAATPGTADAKAKAAKAKEAEEKVAKIGTVGLVDIDLVYTANRLIFMYKGEACCAPESESDPQYDDTKAIFKKRGIPLSSLEELRNVITSDADLVKKVKCRICGQMENFSWLIEIRVPSADAISESADGVDIDKFMEELDGLPENDRTEIESRISWLSKVAPNMAESIMSGFLQRLMTHTNIRPFQPTFIDGKQQYVERCVSAIMLGMNLRLVGPAGCGKNRLVETLQNLFDVDISDIAFSADTNQDSLLGVPTVSSSNEDIDPDAVNKLMSHLLKVVSDEKAAGKSVDDVDWMPLVNAMKGDTAVIKFQLSDLMAKAQRPALLNFDEVNMAPGYITALLHSLTDHRRYINVPGYGVVQMNDEAFIVCTMNEEYEGTRTLNRAFRDRFETVRFSPSQSIAQVLRSEVPSLDAASAKVMDDIYRRIQKVVPDQIQEESLSLRSFIRAAQHRASGWPLKKSVNVIVEDVDDMNDRDAIKVIVDTLVK